MKLVENRNCYKVIKEQLSNATTQEQLNEAKNNIRKNLNLLKENELKSLIKTYHQRGGKDSFKEELSLRDKKYCYVVENYSFNDKDTAIEFAKNHNMNRVVEKLAYDFDGDNVDDVEDVTVWENENPEDEVYVEEDDFILDEDEPVENNSPVCVGKKCKIKGMVPFINEQQYYDGAYNDVYSNVDDYIADKAELVKYDYPEFFGTEFELEIPDEYLIGDDETKQYIDDYVSDRTGYHPYDYEYEVIGLDESIKKGKLRESKGTENIKINFIKDFVKDFNKNWMGSASEPISAEDIFYPHPGADGLKDDGIFEGYVEYYLGKDAKEDKIKEFKKKFNAMVKDCYKAQKFADALKKSGFKAEGDKISIKESIKESKKKLTEAPDELGFPTDEEIEEEQRAEFEKQLAQRKAERDKAKTAELERIKKDEELRKQKEEEVKKQEQLKANGEKLYNKCKELPFDDWFDLLVPSEGPADTEAGEIYRAMSRVVYRWYNDGDMFFEGYGRETCIGSMYYLVTELYDLGDSELAEQTDAVVAECSSYAFSDYTDKEKDEIYEQFIKQLQFIIKQVLLNNPECFGEPNKVDSRDQFDEDGESQWDEPVTDYEIDLDEFYNRDGICLTDFIESGDIDVDDIINEYEDWFNNDRTFYDVEIDRPWGHSDHYITLQNVNREAYDELERYRKNYKEYQYMWEDYINDLVSEYGNPNAEEEEEEEDYEDEDYEDEEEDDEVDESLNTNNKYKLIPFKETLKLKESNNIKNKESKSKRGARK